MTALAEAPSAATMAPSIRISDESIGVVVEMTGDANAGAVDSAYRSKYGVAGATSMITTEAAASTLRLIRES